MCNIYYKYLKYWANLTDKLNLDWCYLFLCGYNRAFKVIFEQMNVVTKIPDVSIALIFVDFYLNFYLVDL